MYILKKQEVCLFFWILHRDSKVASNFDFSIVLLFKILTAHSNFRCLATHVWCKSHRVSDNLKKFPTSLIKTKWFLKLVKNTRLGLLEINDATFRKSSSHASELRYKLHLLLMQMHDKDIVINIFLI